MTNDELNRKIEQAAGKVTKLRGELAKAEETYWALRVKLAELKGGIKVGDRVTWTTYGPDGPQFGYVSSLHLLPGGTVYYHVRREKKDGSPAQTATTVYASVTLAPKEAP